MSLLTILIACQPNWVDMVELERKLNDQSNSNNGSNPSTEETGDPEEDTGEPPPPEPGPPIISIDGPNSAEFGN